MLENRAREALRSADFKDTDEWATTRFELTKTLSDPQTTRVKIGKALLFVGAECLKTWNILWGQELGVDVTTTTFGQPVSLSQEEQEWLFLNQ